MYFLGPVDYSLPGSSIQARILEWVAISFFSLLQMGDSFQSFKFQIKSSL